MRLLSRKLAATAGLLALVTLLPACGPTILNHGYRLDQARLDQVRPGSSTRQDVAQIMGSPSSVSSFDDADWYYISQRSEKKIWSQDKVLEQDVVIVSFDPSGRVTSVGRRDLAQAEAVSPSSDKTATAGNQLTLVQEFFGNLGRFNVPVGAGAGSRRPPGG